jgi:hypothetical protein
MLGSKEYIGIALDNRTVDLVRVKVNGKKIKIEDFVRDDLVVPLDATEGGGFKSEHVQASDAVDEIFGFDDAEEQEMTESGDVSDELEEIDFDDLDGLDDMEEEEDVDEEYDMVDESDQPDSNEMLLYSYLSSIGSKKHNIGLNIRAGDTVFQFARETNYGDFKQKELQELVENKLHSVYGEIPSKDNYSYFVRNDGVLSIASIDREPPSLQLINRVNDIFETTSVYIRDIIPDEVALTGLYRQNYPIMTESAITALVQFGAKRCRIIFFKGHNVLQVSPVINEGTSDKGFLSTVFSKILFQLDTGEVPGLDRIILCDNTIGEQAVEFFQKNFPDIEVSEFEVSDDSYEVSESDRQKIREFTTALAVAVGASGIAKDDYPELSIVPKYIQDRQKVFQLQWHGIAILIAIGLSPIILNHFYQQNVDQITELQAENTRVTSLITDIRPVVEETQRLEGMLASYQEQLVLLDELSQDNIRWTVSFDRFNEAVDNVGNIWISSFRETSEGLMIDGRSLFQNRIPMLARQFGDATLLNVRQEEVRDWTLYHFTMRVNRVAEEESLYTPEESRDIVQFLESIN